MHACVKPAFVDMTREYNPTIDQCVWDEHLLNKPAC